jgi:hypothetical protein
MAVTYVELIAALGNVANAQSQGQIVGDLQGLLDGQNKELTDLVLDHADINTILRYVGNIDNNVAALITQVGVLTANLTALGLKIPDPGAPVVLPPTPPPWYIAPSPGISAADVWAYFYPGQLIPQGEVLLDTATGMQNLGTYCLFPLRDSPYFAPGWVITEDILVDGGLPLPQPIVSNILVGDTLLSWLTRELPGWTLTPNYNSSGLIGAYIVAPYWTYYCLLNDIEFAELQGAIFPATPEFAAPVWPGLARVTLGAPLALVDGLFVPGPLDGVLVSVTSVPYPISYYPFGPIPSYVRAGAIMFTVDDGHGEFPQPFGPRDQVICPKTMGHADNAWIRLPSGVIGTVTPWTIA